MDTKIKHLHTAVRRYCINRYDYWTRQYSEIVSAGKDRSSDGYTQDALRTFPRYNVLNAILVEIERQRPEDLRSLDEAKNVFRTIAVTAQGIFTRPPNDPLAQEAMTEERNALDQFIVNSTDADLSADEPLFYRRVLTAEEGWTIRERLRESWGVTEGYWYPLAKCRREDIEAFQDKYFDDEVGPEMLREILRAYDVETFWELREDDINFESELSILRPFYNGNEGYWCDATLSWIIYASHESSITIGGWLLADVKKVWPDWKSRVWTTPFFD